MSQAIQQERDRLLQGCRANNRQAQEALYRLFYGFAMGVALRYSRDEHDAADILSQAFVKVFKHIHSFDETKGTLHTWIKRIIVNEGLKYNSFVASTFTHQN